MNEAVPAIQRALIFGGTGAIGQAIVERFQSNGWSTTTVSRGVAQSSDVVSWDPCSAPGTATVPALAVRGPFDAVCWAQGKNANDSVFDVAIEAHLEMYNANVVYVLSSLKVLLDSGLLAPKARLVVLSSIWQNMARQNKLSYTVTKAALQGLVLSAANDLGRAGHLINAVLPGVLDTPMTRKNLSSEQVDAVTAATQFGRLPTLADVSAMTYFLCSPENTGVTGQFIKVDLGFSDVRVI